MQKVTGLGGVFIKAKDPKALCEWYQKHLGIGFNGNTYIAFTWTNEKPEEPGSTVFSFFPQDTKYFSPSEGTVMINFRVADLASLLEELQKDGIEKTADVQEESYGKFCWIMDPEGNKIELWEPVGS